MKKLSCSIVLQLSSIMIIFFTLFTPAIPAQDSKANVEKSGNFVPDFSITSPQYYYMPGESVKIQLSSNEIHTSEVFDVKVYLIEDPETFLTKQKNRGFFSIIGRDSSNLMNILEEVRVFKKTIFPTRVKNTDQFVFTGTISYIPPQKGAYIMRISHKNKILTCGFFVTNLAILTRFTQNAVLNYTSDRMTTEPVDSVKFKVYFNTVKLGEGISPGSALAYTFSWKDKESLYRTGTTYPLIIAEKNSDIAVSDPALFFQGNDRPFTAIIVTDQPVYRPPASVKFKITLREMTDSGYAIYAKRDVKLWVKDSKGASLYRKFITTDGFGSYSDSVNIEEGAPLGTYNIIAEVTEDSDDSTGNDLMIYQTFNQAFEVEEYKKPEYKVELKTDKEQYRNKDTIKIEVQSDYYFGSPVQDGEVTYNVYKKTLYRPWWYYSEYRWWYSDYFGSIESNQSYSNSVYIYTGKGKLDESGNFKVTYVIDEDFKEGNEPYPYETDYIYIVSAGVVDKSRRLVSSTKSANVTRSDYFINAHPDRRVCKPGEKIGLTVKARDFSDKPVEANYIVTVNRIIYEKKVRVTTFLTTVSGMTSYLGDDVIFIDTESEGYYELEIASFDAKKIKISDKTGCFVSAGRMDWWYREPGIIEIIPEKESYFPGDTAVAYVVAPHDDVNLFITNHNRNIVSYWVEKLSGNSAYIKIPITDASSPNFYFTVAYVKDGKYFSNNRSIAVIPRNKFLNVTLSSDKPIYKPQEEGTVKISVKDNLGNPVKNSEVTIGIIDESIYAIAPENIKDIRSVFYGPYIDQSYASYNLRGNNRYYVNSSFAPLFERYDARSPENKMCEVNGTIFDEYGRIRKNVTILIDGMYLASSSNEKGNFNFNLPEGEYSVSLAIGNYAIPGSIKMFFKHDGENELQIKTSLERILFAELNKELVITETLEKGAGKINGIVKDENGKPIVGAVIILVGTNIGTQTDQYGRFEIKNIPNGIYSIRCNYAEYQSSDIEGIDPEVNGTKSVSFKMTRGYVSLDTIAIVLDTIQVIETRRGIETDQSGRIITSLPFEINQHGIRGIENIVAKTSGIVEEQNQVYASVIFVGEKNPKEEFVEAVTRTDFRDAMLWMPAVYTDENGNAEVKVKFPDNLTTWRVTARVITANTDVGQNTYSMTERKDLIIRVETPRFFQQNDEVTVSTIVHNYLDEEKTAKVTMKLDNLELLDNSTGEQLITIGKNEEKRVDWRVRVNYPIGIGNVTASALTNEESDAMKMVVPIQPFGLKVTNFSSYDLSKSSGSITKKFEIPENTDTRSASLKFGISPSIASSLLGSLDYLIGYPYGCIEQTMSRFMPSVIAANTLKEFGAPDDPFFTKQIPKMVQKGFDKIYYFQHTDGGWGWWQNDKSDPYMSAYVLYGLQLAGQNGYKVKQKYLTSGRKFLERSLGNKKLDATSRSFIIFVLSSDEKADKKLIDKQFTLLAKKETSSLAKALISLAAGKMLRNGTQQKYIRDVMREVNFTGDDMAFWGAQIKRYSWHDDNIITTALVLKALLADPESAKENKDFIEKAVNWLLEMRQGYAWGNTLQNAFIIYSLTDYLKQYKELEPDYELKIFVNGKLAAEKHITKEDIFKKEDKFIVTGDMLKTGENEIRIEKSGPGKTYFTTGVTYYEKESKKKISETDNGYEIEREYYELKKVFDQKKKIYTYKKKKLDGIVESGSEILVKVKVFPSGSSSSYFMLEDPIPAGCEHIKEDWAYPIEGENSYQGRSKNIWNWWYADKDIRDNRIVFFASYLQEQEYEFSYLLRAQIPGTFNIMPTKGMLMYYPEYNGSGTNQVLKIVDKQE